MMHEPLDDSECDCCDDYLAGALGPDDRESFEQHLERCAFCAAAIREDRAIRELLIAATSSEPIPGRLQEPFGKSLRSSHVVDRLVAARPGRRRLRASAVLVAAAVTIGLSSWLLFDSRPRSRPLSGSAESTTHVPIDASMLIDTPLVEAQIGAPDDFITVPVKSRDPKISIFWAYPTKRVTRDDDGRSRPRLLNSLSSPSSGEST
jgi:anti-sigma factor RsiW